MSEYTIVKYQQSDKVSWDHFVKNSKNGTFLFYRDFMEYHADRFEDASLIVYKKDTIIALFPANRIKNEIYSHQGLTYGGLLLKKSIGGKKIDVIVAHIISFYKNRSVSKLTVKAIPLMYHQVPSHEFNFFLKNRGAITTSSLNLAIDYSKPLRIHKSKIKHFKKGKNKGLLIKETEDISDFWNEVLVPRLLNKHNVSPVHSLLEIQQLHTLFPKNIKQFNIYLNDQILAGITVFISGKVVKSQYGATTSKGEEYNALDYLFITLIYQFKKENYHYFDMGTVTDTNFGLLKQKEELGCEIYTQDFYKFTIS